MKDIRRDGLRLDASTARRVLRRAEWIAVVTTAAAFALTALLVSGGRAVEANPVAAGLLSVGGWAAAGVVAIGAEVAIIAVYRRLAARGYRRAAVAGGVALAAVGVGDVLANVWLLARVGVPESVYWAHYGPAVALVALAALVVLGRPNPWPALYRVGGVVDRYERGVVWAAVGLVVLSAVLAGVPASVFGPDAPAESVDRAAGASSWSYLTSYSDITRAVAVNSTNYTYTVNSGTVRIHNNDFSTQVGSWSTIGSVRVRGLDIGPNGNVWTDNSSDGELYEYDAQSGSVVSNRDLSTHSKRITAVEYDSTNDEWWVGYGTSGPIYLGQFDSNFNRLTEYDISADLSSSEVGGIVVFDGEVYVGDPTTTNVRVYDRSGNLQRSEDASNNNGGGINGLGKRPSGNWLTADTSFNEVDEYSGIAKQTVSGQVTDADGNAIADAAVTITDSGGSQVASLTTNSSGDYSTSLSGGDYTITVDATDYASASKSITVAGSAVTQDFSLSYTGDDFEYTLGMCYEAPADFHGGTADADFYRRYLTDGTHPDSKLPDRSTDLVSGTIRSYNGPNTAYSAIYESIATRLGFDTDDNVTTTVTDPDSSPYTWGVRAEIETDRAYWNIQGIDPSAARPYDQFVVSPPFDDGDDRSCDESSGGGGGGTPTPVPTPPGNDSDNLRPRAYFTYDPLLPNTTTSVRFEADASDSDGSIDHYRWQFPDGKASGPNATHTFTENGSQPVTLRVVDDDGANATYTADVYVSEAPNRSENLPPFAWFSYDPIAPRSGENVTFTADASDTDGEIRNLSWRIEGRHVTNGSQMTVAFDGAGQRNVSLRAVDDDTASGWYNATVYVQENATSLWGAPDATAFGTCSLPSGNGTTERGILLEYWDPDYETVALHTTVTWNGTEYDIDTSFDSAKGYYFGCVGVGEDVAPGDVADDALANTTVEFENGTETTYNDSGIGDFSPENAIGGSGGFTFGGGGGPLVGESAGAGAPLWATGLPALGALAFVAYRRYRKQGGSAAGSRGGGGPGAGGGGGSAGGGGGGGSGGILGRFGGGR